MNIFYLDHNPKICAEMHLDKHSSKMLVEYAQLLSTAHRVLDGKAVKRLSKNNRLLTTYDHPTRDHYLYKDISIEKQVPNELIVAQAVVETGWGDSRFANEANNLFGIRTFDRDDNYMLPKTLTNWPGWGVKVFASKCDSVEYYVRIINEVWAYEAFRSLRQRHLNDGVIPDGMELAMTLDSYATDPNYIPLVRSVIKNNIRGVYDL